MKKIIMTLMLLIGVLCTKAQNIKFLELTQDSIFTPSPVGDEWRDVDSIVATGTLGSKNYYQLHVLAEYFNLTGLNLESCTLDGDSIEDRAFKPFKICVHIKGLGNDYGYSSVRTEERYFRTNLKHIVFPETLRKIGEAAFYRNNLETLEIPSSVCNIGDNAFSECCYLKTVYVNVQSPEEVKLGVDVFRGLPEDAILCVPDGAKEAFAADINWGSAFKVIVDRGELSGLKSVTAEIARASNGMIYTCDGRCVGNDFSRLSKGIYVVNGKKILK